MRNGAGVGIPSVLPGKQSDRRVLVVGAGPAGLEAARALGQRGYEVHVAEAEREVGGRVSLESRLPGLAEWARVRDWRLSQINKMSNVTIYRDNRLTPEDVLGFDAQRVVLATGCQWRRDGYGRSNGSGIRGLDGANVFTPDDVLRGVLPDGPVLLFDDDYFYMGSVLAEVLRAAGREVIYVTPDDAVASWTTYTHEFRHIQKRLRQLEVQIVTSHNLTAFDEHGATLRCVYSDREQRVECRSLLTITARLPNEDLHQALLALEPKWADAGIEAVTAIGDCLAPGLIAHAVYSGHRYAQEFDAAPEGEVRFRRRTYRGE